MEGAHTRLSVTVRMYAREYARAGANYVHRSSAYSMGLSRCIDAPAIFRVGGSAHIRIFGKIAYLPTLRPTMTHVGYIVGSVGAAGLPISHIRPK